MTYVGPEFIEESAVFKQIETATDYSSLSKTVLSAIFYCDTPIAGDAVLKAFSKVHDSNRIYVGILATTFFGVHRSAYKIECFLEHMQKPCDDSEEMQECIYDVLSTAFWVEQYDIRSQNWLTRLIGPFLTRREPSHPTKLNIVDRSLKKQSQFAYFVEDCLVAIATANC